MVNQLIRIRIDEVCNNFNLVNTFFCNPTVTKIDPSVYSKPLGGQSQKLQTGGKIAGKVGGWDKVNYTLVSE